MIKKNKSEYVSFFFGLVLVFFFVFSMMSITFASHNYGGGALLHFNDTFTQLINYSFYANHSGTINPLNITIRHQQYPDSSGNATYISGRLGGMESGGMSTNAARAGLLTLQNISANTSFYLSTFINFTNTTDTFAVANGGDITSVSSQFNLGIFNVTSQMGQLFNVANTYCQIQIKKNANDLALFNSTADGGSIVQTGFGDAGGSLQGTLKFIYNASTHNITCSFDRSDGTNYNRTMIDVFPTTGVRPGFFGELTYTGQDTKNITGNLNITVDNFIYNDTISTSGGGGSTNPYTTILQNSTDLFTGSTINTTLWNISYDTQAFTVFQNGQLVINGTKNGDTVNDGRFDINSSYVNFSYDWTANITVFPINLSGVMALNVSTNAFQIVAWTGAERSVIHRCAIQYQRSGLKVNVTAGIGNGSEGFEKSSVGFGYGQLNTTIFATYTASSRALNCSFITNQGNTTSFKIVLDDYSARSNQSIGYGTGLLGLTGEPAVGYTSIGWDLFNFTTEYPVPAQQQEEGEEAVPEFSDYALLLALGLTIGGVMIIKKKKTI